MRPKGRSESLLVLQRKCCRYGQAKATAMIDAWWGTTDRVTFHVAVSSKWFDPLINGPQVQDMRLRLSASSGPSKFDR